VVDNTDLWRYSKTGVLAIASYGHPVTLVSSCGDVPRLENYERRPCILFTRDNSQDTCKEIRSEKSTE